MPWQQLVADVALELLPDGSFAYSEIVLTVPRQSGKTTLIMAKCVWRLVILAKSHGPQVSTYTAQTRQAARKKLERTFIPCLRRAKSFPEVPHQRARPRRRNEFKGSLNNGSEHVAFGGDSYWQLEATGEESGHGDTIDDGTIDEARFQVDDTIEAAMGPAMSTRRDPQTWVISTVGNEKSVYLYRKVLAGREACKTGRHGTVAYFEWSAPDDAEPGDPEVWRACMPALGLTVSERFIAGEWAKAQRGGQEKIDTFRNEYLNIWVTVPVLEEDDEVWVFPKPHWTASASPRSTIVGPAAFALEVSHDRAWSAFAAAGASSVGGVHGEVIAYKRGTDWVVAAAKELHEKWGGKLVISKASPAISLVPELVAAGVEVELYSTEDQARACGLVHDALIEGRFKHLPALELNVAVAGAERADYGNAWVLSPKRSTVDISTLVALVNACARFLIPAEPETEAGYYSSSGTRA